eukprot:7333630-Pyramimonas_sp.AAC.1
MVTGLRTPNTSPYATKGSLIALYRQCYPQILANFRTGFETACLTRLKLTRLACTEFTAFVRHVQPISYFNTIRREQKLIVSRVDQSKA